MQKAAADRARVCCNSTNQRQCKCPALSCAHLTAPCRRRACVPGSPSQTHPQTYRPRVPAIQAYAHIRHAISTQGMARLASMERPARKQEPSHNPVTATSMPAYRDGTMLQLRTAHLQPCMFMHPHRWHIIMLKTTHNSAEQFCRTSHSGHTPLSVPTVWERSRCESMTGCPAHWQV